MKVKKFWIVVVGVVLAFGPAMLAQEVVTGVKDVSKDIDKGAKKTAKGYRQDCRCYEGRRQGYCKGQQEGCKQDR